MANPRGQQRDKPFAAALRLEIASVKKDDPKSLRRIARNLLSIAAGEDKDRMAAIKEIADRLDGKPAQALVGDDGGPISVSVVKFTEAV